jgi:hypothetical protein
MASTFHWIPPRASTPAFVVGDGVAPLEVAEEEVEEEELRVP